MAFDLAGMGDLHVTVGGGRNSRLGRYLGEGEDAVGDDGRTDGRGNRSKGVDTGRALAAGFGEVCAREALDTRQLPLTRAILGCVEDDRKFELDYAALPS